VNYLDTSALVKRFVAEKGSQRVEEMLTTGEPAATSKIGYAEVHAALARRRREGGLSTNGYALACRSFEEDWKTYVRVDLRDEVLQLARDLIKRRPLRGFDAIHLASALTLGRELGEPMRFVAADARLLDAAKAERLRVMNPEG
jgi:predicted nucleic acid-binding protein